LFPPGNGYQTLIADWPAFSACIADAQEDYFVATA
jgi:hypothetical protein